MNRGLYKPSVLRSYLEELGVTPKKSLGQHFLIDQNVLQRIISLAKVQEDDAIVEIGPGPGVLTDFLLDAGACVTAIERDSLYANEHRERKLDTLQIVEGDVLEVDFRKILDPNKRYKLVANLPYNISTPIFEKIFEVIDLFSSMTVMVQKEVADRMKAPPGSKDYGALSLFIKMHGETTDAFSVSANSFYPPPNVTSAVVHVQLEEKTFSTPKALIQRVIRHLFTKRRKMIRAGLRDLYSKEEIQKALEDTGISDMARPETLSLTQFAQLAQALADHRG